MVRHTLGALIAVTLPMATACKGGVPPTPTAPTSFAGNLVQTTAVQSLEAAGSIGGGVLTPGDSFPPTSGSLVTLYRDDRCLAYTLETTGLPPGAYTNWWLIFNDPAACTGASFGTSCGFPDFPPALGNLFDGTASRFTAGWAAGGVVEVDGVGSFAGRTCIGERFGTPGPTQHLGGPGLLAPMTAVVWFFVKYHGPASDNPDVLYWQLHSDQGSCQSGANGAPRSGDLVACPNVQAAGFDAP